VWLTAAYLLIIGWWGMPDTGGPPEIDTKTGKSTARTRVLLILIVIVVVLAVTLGSMLLGREVELSWGLLPVLTLFTAGIMAVLSGVGINSLQIVVPRIWRMKEDETHKIPDALRSLGKSLGRPLRLTSIVVTVVALVVAAWAWRPQPGGLEPGELVVMSAFPSDPGDSRTMLLQQWNRLNPNNRARFDHVSLSHDGQHARMVADAKPGGSQKADIYVVDIVWMAEFIRRGYIQQLNESTLPASDLGDFIPKVLDTCRDDSGKLWALPLNSDVGLIYLRTDVPGMVAPETWGDYFGAGAKNMVAAARADDPDIKAANAAQLSVTDEMLTITALEAIWAAGGRMVAPNGQVTLTPDQREVEFGDEDRAAVRNLAAAAHDPDLVLFDDESRRSSAEAATRAFADGRTVYMRNWPVASENLGVRVPYLAVTPPTNSVLGGQNLAISASTEKPRAAQALIQFLTNASSQQILSEVGGFVPTRQSAFTYAKRRDAPHILAALNDARLRPVTPCYVEFSQLFRKGIDVALDNDGRLEGSFGRELAEVLRC
jgi:multiple sugar transport system substrate-binding protein